MRRPLSFAAFLLAAACWLALGPGGVAVRALLACRHHALHDRHAGHAAGAPADAPCFCDEMTGGSVAVVSPAAPAPVAVLPPAAPPERTPPDRSPSRPPLSPAFPPTPPPPNGLV